MSNHEKMPEEIPEIYQSIADEIGLENTIKLANLFDGESVYFPKKEALTRASRNKQIIDDFKNGLTFKKIAKKYNLSEMHVRLLIRENFKNSKKSL